MMADKRIRDLAQVIVAKHGEASLAVVLDRARVWREADDEPWVSVWTQVAEEVRNMIPGHHPERRPASTLLSRIGARH
jgi:hypothetical protein